MRPSPQAGGLGLVQYLLFMEVGGSLKASSTSTEASIASMEAVGRFHASAGSFH